MLSCFIPHSFIHSISVDEILFNLIRGTLWHATIIYNFIRRGRTKKVGFVLFSKEKGEKQWKLIKKPYDITWITRQANWIYPIWYPTTEGSITSIQVVYLPIDDLTNLAPTITFAHLDATNVLSRGLTAKGIYPIVDF